MLTRRQALDEARENMARGTTTAARVRDTTADAEVRELAKAVHLIGYGAQQIALAFTERGRVDDL